MGRARSGCLVGARAPTDGKSRYGACALSGAGLELRLKWGSFHIAGSRKGPVDLGAVVRFAAAIGWAFLPVTANHAAARLSHPLTHSDPFDELLLVQAQEKAMRLLTRGSKLVGYRFALVAEKS